MFSNVNLQFRKNCQTWSQKAHKLIKSGKVEEVKILKEELTKNIIKYEEQEKIIRFRKNMLKGLLSQITRGTQC